MSLHPWSKIELSNPILKEALVEYGSIKRVYHDINHVIDLYLAAEEIGIPYRDSLDWAILTHDVKMREEEAMLWCESRGLSTAVSALIETTKDHRPTVDGSLLALCDLWSFTDPAKARIGTKKVLQEHMVKSVIDDNPTFLADAVLGTKLYLMGLVARIRAGLQENEALMMPKYLHAWQKVCEGIDMRIQEMDAEYN